MALDEQAILQKVKAAPPYDGVDDDAVLRIIRELWPRYKKEKDALKAVRTRLHIIHGVYYPEKCHQKALELIRGFQGPDRELSLRLLALHPSTRERLPSLEAFYAFLAPYLRDAHTVLDIGCGFHPCAFPFMGLPDDAAYRAGDIDLGAAQVVRAFFQRLGRPVQAGVLDAAREIPSETADAAFLLKLLPVLNQQEKGLGARLLQNLRARYAVVTFPVRSLSGRDREMEDFYSRQFEASLPPGLSILEKRTIGTELVYVTGRGTGIGGKGPF